MLIAVGGRRVVGRLEDVVGKVHVAEFVATAGIGFDEESVLGAGDASCWSVEGVGCTKPPGFGHKRRKGWRLDVCGGSSWQMTVMADE